jgi:hypothetical protein
MNTRRIICTLLGMWIGASLFMAAVAAFSFRLVNELIVNPAPEMAPYFKLLGSEKLRILARHQAAEFNRSLFDGWGMAQILLGLLIFGILLFGTKEGKLVLGLSLFMVLLTTGMHVLVTPSIIGYGRSLDFVGPDKEPDLRRRVDAFHKIYSSLEGVKLLCGASLLVIFFLEVKRRPGRGGEDREDGEAA